MTFSENTMTSREIPWLDDILGMLGMAPRQFRALGHRSLGIVVGRSATPRSRSALRCLSSTRSRPTSSWTFVERAIVRHIDAHAGAVEQAVEQEERDGLLRLAEATS